jgi:DNA-binding LytR/AlgR family response regulator|tara:strand:+ start:5712 stop:6377 length:666 start_codon:yes stop_codon:yes gene_type:complete
MVNCIIIEDQIPAQYIIEKYISDTDNLSLKGTFTDAIIAKEFLKNETIDLIFLDIHLPKISGIEFLKTIENGPRVILTTAFSDYAFESYEMNVLDYLLKPIGYERFLKAILKFPLVSNTAQEDSIILKLGHEHIKIDTATIKYIKSDSDYTEVFTVDKVHLSKDSLKQWLERLNPAFFCQIHKSYLINTKYLEKVSGNVVFLQNLELPIGRSYKKNFINRF